MWNLKMLNPYKERLEKWQLWTERVGDIKKQL